MNKVLKIFLYLIGVIVVLGIAFATFIQVRGIPSYEAKDPGLKVEITPERVANGKKMVTLLCGECHFNKDRTRLTGHLLSELPDLFGEIHSKNITNDKEHGIGNWTDGQLAYLFRTGVSKTGQFYPPYMPKFVHLSDEDVNSVIAYLRSDDALVQASDEPNVPSHPSWMTKFLCFVAFKPTPYPTEKIIAPLVTDKLAYGKYLTTAKYECYQCHSRDFKTNNILEPEKSPGFFGGGNAMITRERKQILTANITMDPETGIGNWTEAEFIAAVKSGVGKTGPMRYPMVPWTQLGDDEVSAIYAYLKTVPPIKNKVDRSLKDL